MIRKSFYFLALIALLLCTAGILRYDRNEGKHRFLSKNIPLTSGRKDPNAKEIHFFTEIDLGLEAASREKKPILLVITAQNCRFSQQLLTVTFQAEAVRKYLDRFVLVDIDMNSHADLCRQWNIESTPTIQFMSSQGVSLQRYNGMTEPEVLASQMSATLQTLASINQSRLR